MPPWQPVREVVTERLTKKKEEKGGKKRYRKKIVSVEKKKTKQVRTEHAFSCLLRLFLLIIFVTRESILAEVLVSLCNMHPDLKRYVRRETKERTRKTKKKRNEGKEETETK